MEQLLNSASVRRIRRILQISEGVNHLGLRHRWIKPSLICKILHTLRKTNSVIAKYYIHIYRCKGDWVQAYNYAGILLEESLWSKVNVVYRNMSYKLLSGLQLKIFCRVHLKSSRSLKKSNIG